MAQRLDSKVCRGLEGFITIRGESCGLWNSNNFRVVITDQPGNRPTDNKALFVRHFTPSWPKK